MTQPGKIRNQGITGSVKECVSYSTQNQTSALRNWSMLSVCTDKNSLRLHTLAVYYPGSVKMDV
jgi:hypothetical protein